MRSHNKPSSITIRKPVRRRRSARKNDQATNAPASINSEEEAIELSSENEDSFIVNNGDVDLASEFERSGSDESGADDESSEDDDEIEIVEQKPITPRKVNCQQVTPPPVTPVSSTKEKGKKRKAKDVGSDDSDDAFVRSLAIDSMKKAKVTPETKPSEKSRAARSTPTKSGILGSPLNLAKSGGSKASVANEGSEDEKEFSIKLLKYLEDLEPQVRFSKLKTVSSVQILSKCGVFDKEIEDVLLKGTYNKLTNLPGGKSIVTWKNTKKEDPKVEFYFFSNVKMYHPKAPIPQIKKLLLFAGDKETGFANLSRINPSELFYKPMGSVVPGHVGLRPGFICYRGQSQPAKLLMMGLVHLDRTKEPYQVNGTSNKWMKSFTIYPFALEFERNVAATCVIAGVDSFVGQIWDNQLTFTTRQGYLGMNTAHLGLNFG